MGVSCERGWVLNSVGVIETRIWRSGLNERFEGRDKLEVGGSNPRRQNFVEVGTYILNPHVNIRVKIFSWIPFSYFIPHAMILTSDPRFSGVHPRRMVHER